MHAVIHSQEKKILWCSTNSGPCGPVTMGYTLTTYSIKKNYLVCVQYVILKRVQRKTELWNDPVVVILCSYVSLISNLWCRIYWHINFLSDTIVRIWHCILYNLYWLLKYIFILYNFISWWYIAYDDEFHNKIIIL